MKNLITLISMGAFVILYCNASSQTLAWSSLSNNNYSTCISVDAAGNSYTMHPYTYRVEKRSSSGALVWSKQFTGPMMGLNDAATDQLGNLYVVGDYFSDMPQSNYIPGMQFYISVTGGGSISVPFTVVPDGNLIGNKMFFAKINTSGNLEYVKTFSTNTDYGQGHSIATDINNNVYLLAEGSSSMYFDGVGSLNNIHPMFLLKMNSTGACIYVNQISNNTYYLTNVQALTRNHLAVNNSGEVAIAHQFMGTRIFDPNGSAVSLTSAGYNDVYILRYNSSGGFMWAKRFGSGPQHESCNAIVLNSTGTLWMTGLFGSTCDFDPGAGVVNKTASGTRDMYVLSLNSSGTYQWVVTFGGTGDESQLSLMQSQFDLILTGSFTGTVDFNPGAGIANQVSAGGKDIFILNLGKSSGTYNGAIRTGSTGDDFGFDVSIANPNAQAPYLINSTGTFDGTVDFNPGAGVSNLTTTSTAKSYVCRYTIDSGSGRFGNDPSLGSANANAVQINVFPTPAVSEINIISDSRVFSVSVYSMSGSLLYSEKIDGATQFMLGLDQFEKGIYIMEMQTEAGRMSKKIIKD